MTKQRCYNKACGKEYDEGENGDEACRFHPGVPIFHEGLKGWSCCKKRTADFSEFLEMPGCTRGPHNNVKPPEPEKAPKAEPMKEGEVITVEAPRKPIAQKPAEVSTAEKVKLPVTVTASALPPVTASSTQSSVATDDFKSIAGPLPRQGAVVPGTLCKNSACGKAYVDESSNEEVCRYHPGAPVFHEGSKYWSCCTKRTHDFDEFLNQKGCAETKHVWTKPVDVDAKKVACRHDWFQTGSHVSISVYAKKVDPAKSSFEANSTSLSVSILFEGNNLFTLDIHLGGIIDPAASKVMIMGTKVEISLRKAEASNWAQLTAQSI